MEKACMVVHSYYPADPRVRREAEALLDAGWAVEIICLRGSSQPAVEDCGGATVYRLPVRRHRGSGIAVYLLEYFVFFVLASLRLIWLHLRRRYDVIQVHTMPDFLVFVGLFPRLMGARVVLDIHDLVPELYMLKFGGNTDHPVVRITRWVERQSCAFADHVLTAGEPFRRRLIARGVPGDKVTVVMNSADPRLFSLRPPDTYRSDGNFTVMYHGGLFERYGLHIAVRAVAELHTRIPELQLRIYGEGEAVTSLRRLIEELRAESYISLGGFVPLDTIPDLVQQADVGVVPYLQNPFTDLLYPTKAFEYIAMGVPVIISRTGAILELFAEVPDLFVEPGDVNDLALRILELYQNRARRIQLGDAAQRVYAPHTWERQRQAYLLLMGQLTAMHRAPASL
jgi:glycosyltransferase involved in cell wall biosynthesis